MAKHIKMNDADHGNATPFGHYKPVGKSGEAAHTPASTKLMAERPWTGATPMSASGKTKPNLPNLPSGGTKSHPNLSKRTSSASPAYGPGSSMQGVGISGQREQSAPNLAARHKKWSKKGYSMTLPTSSND